MSTMETFHPVANIDELRELANYAAYHKLEAVFISVQQVLQTFGFNSFDDPMLQKRMEFFNLMKACHHLDYSSMGKFEVLLVSFDSVFRSQYVNMKQKGLTFLHWISKREKIVRQIGLSLLYNRLMFTFGRCLPDLPSEIDLRSSFSYVRFENELAMLLKRKELTYPCTQSEIRIMNETFKGRNLEQLRNVVGKRDYVYASTFPVITSTTINHQSFSIFIYHRQK